MTTLTHPMVEGVEALNDRFALQHDIDDYYSRSSPLIRWVEGRRLAAIRRLLAATAEHRILEVGCGGGHVLRMFPQSKLTGVDVSGQMLAKAQRNLDGCRARLLKGELHEVGLGDGEFDRVICTEVLEHTVDPDQVLSEIRRVLHPDGRVVITFPNDHLIHRVKHVLRSSGVWRLPVFGRIAWGGDEYHLHVWTPREMAKLLGRHFVVERSRFVPAQWFPIRCCFVCRHLNEEGPFKKRTGP